MAFEGTKVLDAHGPNRIREDNAWRMPTPACEFPITASIGIQIPKPLEVQKEHTDNRDYVREAL